MHEKFKKWEVQTKLNYGLHTSDRVTRGDKLPDYYLILPLSYWEPELGLHRAWILPHPSIVNTGQRTLYPSAARVVAKGFDMSCDIASQHGGPCLDRTKNRDTVEGSFRELLKHHGTFQRRRSVRPWNSTCLSSIQAHWINLSYVYNEYLNETL